MWFLIFAGTAALISLVLSFREPTEESAQQRLERLVGKRKALEGFVSGALPGAPEEPGAKGQKARRSVRQALVGLVEQATRGSRFTDRLAIRLQRADWRWKPAEFLFAQVIASGIGAAVAILFMPTLIWLLPVVGWVLPLLLLGRAEKSRQKLFSDQLPDALTIIANALRSGYALLQAMEVVSREMPEPIAKEFGLVLREARVNVPLEASLANLVNRIHSEDLDLMVTAVMIQRQVGGNLSEVLDKISDTIKERIKIQGEIRTLSTQGRFSGWVISLLPVVLALLLQVVSPGFLDPMLQSPIGWLLMGIALVMQTTGILIIRNMVNLEV